MENNIYIKTKRNYFFSWLIVLMSITAVMFSSASFGQNAGYYAFSTDTSGSLTKDKDGNAIDMTSGAVVVHAASTDGYTAFSLPIGFSFNFSGVAYTNFTANPDGQVQLGSTPVISGSTQSPALNTAKFVVMNSNNATSVTGQVTQKTQMGTGGLVFIVEWKDIQMPASGTGTDYSNFQLRLYQASGLVEMVYGSMYNSSASVLSGSVGISNSTGASNLGVVTLLTTTMTHSETATSFTTTSLPVGPIPNLNANTDSTCRVFRFTPPGPCVAPTDQANALVLTPQPFVSTQINGTFNPAASLPDGYLVVRYPSGSPITDPVDGTSYAGGATLGLGTVVGSGTHAQIGSFSATGLTFATSYDFVIYSMSFRCTGGPPFYNILNPLIATGTTNGNTVPSCNTTVSPTSGSINIALNPTITWSGSIGTPTPYAYDVYLDTNFSAVSNLSPSVKRAAAISTASFLPSTYLGYSLSPGTVYYWVAIPINATGTASGCAPNSFTTTLSVGRTASAIGGLWTDVNTWTPPVVPLTGDSVTIPYGVTVTMNSATTVTLSQLEVKGTLKWNSSTTSLTVIGDINIDTGGVFLPYNTATTGQTITVGGDFINNGYADFSIGTSTVSPALIFNGTQQGGGSSYQVLGGTGRFEGKGDYGIIRGLTFATNGTVEIATDDTIVSYTVSHAAGTLETGGRLKIDNTIQAAQSSIHESIRNVAITTSMGTAYTAPPVVAPTGALNWVSGTKTANTVWVNNGQVYVVTLAGSSTVAPTHIGGASQAPSGGGVAKYFWVGTTGTIGSPILVTPANGTSYFYGSKLFTSLRNYTAGDAAFTAGVATSLAAASVGTVVTVGPNKYLCVGTPATVSVSYDASTQNVRNLILTNIGLGYRGALTASQGFTILPSNSATHGGTAAAGIAVYQQGSPGTANSGFTKGNSAIINGGLIINSTQGRGALGLPQSGVGALNATDRGRNYTVAPLVGFSGPFGLNLVTAQGSGYTSAPTVTFTGGTPISGAYTSANFNITVNQGKLVSVYLNSSTPVYNIPPVLGLSGGGGTGASIAWPSGCWPTATAAVQPDRQLSFTVTNPGYGYVNSTISAAVGNTSGSTEGGTFISAGDTGTVASGLTARVGLYNLTYIYLVPATTNVMNVEGAEIPADRKIHNLQMASPGVGARLNDTLELFGSAPFTLTFGVLDLQGNDLLFSHPTYAGPTTSATFPTTLTCVENGSITLTTRGGLTTATTLHFPFDAPFQLLPNKATGQLARLSNATRITARRGPKPTGLALPTELTKSTVPLGSRTTQLILSPTGSTLGVGSRVTMFYNQKDSLPQTIKVGALRIGESDTISGTWVSISDSVAGLTILPVVASRTSNDTTASTQSIPDMDTLSGNYYAWVSIDTVPNIVSYTPGNFCDGGGQNVTIVGTGFTDVTGVTFNGVAAPSFSVAAKFDTIYAVTPSGISAGNIVIFAAGTTDTSTAYTITTVGAITATVNPANGLICSIPDTVSIVLNDIGADSYIWTGSSGLNTYSGLTVNASPTATSEYTVSALFTGAGCTVKRIFNVGVIETVAPTATATPPNSCFGSSSTVALNSNIVLGNFAVASIPYAEPTLPNDSAASVDTIFQGTGGTSGTRFPYILGGTLDDGGWANVPIGFNFNYFGNLYNELAAGTNGVLMFGAVPGYGTATGQLGQFTFALSQFGRMFPSPGNPANIIAPLASDHIFLNTAGRLRYWTEGFAPTRKFIIEYFDLPHLTNTQRSTFHCVLYETTGIVDVYIKSTTATPAKTVGLQDLTKTIGASAPGREATTATILSTASEGWRFIPPAAYTFQWTPSAGLNYDTVSAPTFTIDSVGTYNYEVEITNPITGCVVTKAVTFSVQPTPAAPTVTGITSVCGSGNTVLFSSLPSPGNTIRWFNDSLAGSEVLPGGGTIYSTPVFSRPTTEDTTFYVTQRSAFCSSPRTPKTVTVTLPPAFSVGDTIVCRGTTGVELKVDSGNADYNEFIWTPVANLFQDPGLTTSYTGQNLQTVYARTTGVDSLKFFVTANNFTTLCIARDSAVVRVQPLSATLTSSPSALCRSGSATLTLASNSVNSRFAIGTVRIKQSTDGITYTDTLYRPSSTLNSVSFITPTLTDTMWYRFEIFDEDSGVCLTYDYRLDVNDPDILSATGASFCGSDSVMLTATSTPGSVINWYNVATGGTILDTGMVYWTDILDTTSRFYLSASVGGCVSDSTRDSVAVTISNTVTLNGNKVVCNNSIAMLTPISNLSDYDTYVWSPMTNLYTDSLGTVAYTGTNEDTIYTKISGFGTYAFQVTATDTVTGCVNYARDTVRVHPDTAGISVTAGSSNLCAPGAVTMRVAPSSKGFAGYYQWQVSADNINWSDTTDTDSTLTTNTLNDNRYFRVLYKNQDGDTCLISSTRAIFVNPHVTSIDTPLVRCGSGNLLLTATGTGDTLQWYSTASSTQILDYGSTFNIFTSGKDTSVFVTAKRGSCIQSPRIEYKITTSPADTLTVNSTKQVVCYNSSTLLRVTSPVDSFDTYVWVPFTKLYLDAGGTIPYTGSNTDSVYHVSGSDTGTYIYTLFATDTTENCGRVLSDTVVVMPNDASLSATSVNLCRKGITTLSVNPKSPFGAASSQWQSSVDNITFNDILNADSVLNYVTDSLLDTTYFRARFRNSLGATCFFSDTITINVNNPPVTSTTTDTICGPGIVNLLATSLSDTLRWYEVDTLGTIKFTGAAYNVAITRTDTFYVASVENGCEGSRSTVIAKMNASDTLILNPNRTVCNSEILLLNVDTSVVGDYNSYIWSPATNLFLNAAATIPYVGTNTDSVYMKRSTPGQIVYTCTALNTTSGCQAVNRDTVDVLRSVFGITANPVRVCFSGNSVLSLSPGTAYADSSIQWQQSSDSITFTNISGAHGVTYTTPAITATTFYRAFLMNSDSDTCVFSSVYKLTFAAPAVLTTTNGSRCGSGTVSLSATGTPGSILKWYTGPSGGSAFATGSTVTSTSITSTTVFYVADSLLGCISTPRTRDTAFVTSPAAFAITPSVVVCNNSSNLLTVTTGGADYDVFTWSPSTGLFLDSAATIPYTGTNTDSVWVKRSTAGNANYSCFAEDTIGDCTSLASMVLSVQPASATNTASPNTICVSGTSVLTLVPSSPYGAGTIQWQRSTDNLTYLDVPAAINASYTTPVISQTRYFRAQIKDAAGNVCFTTVEDTVVVNNPQILTTTSGTRCGIGSVTLYATTTGDAGLNWYSVATGGTVLSTNDTFMTAPIADTTTFYVGASVGTCFGGRTAVIAYMTDGPELTVSDTQAVCNNVITMLTVTSDTANYNVHTWSPTGNLFLDPAASIPYTNENTDTVYFRTTTPGYYSIRDTATNTNTSCVNVKSAVVFVQRDISTVAATPDQLCSFGNVNLTLVPASPYFPNSVQWQRSDDNIVYNDIDSATNPTRIDTLSYSAYYHAIVYDGNNNICFTTNYDSVRVTNPSFVSVSNDTVCGFGTADLVAIADTGEYVLWYADSIGGAYLDSTSTFTTPSLDSTRTYWVAAVIPNSLPANANVGVQSTTLGAAIGNPYRAGSGAAFQVRTQLLIRASELAAAGVTVGYINSIGFTTTAVAGTMVNMTIKAAITNATVLTTTYQTAPMTTVWTQASFTPLLGLNTHTFTSPVYWNGSSNLLIEVCQENSVLGTTTVAANSPGFTGTTANTAVGGCTALTGTTSATRPIMQFNYTGSCSSGRIPVKAVVTPSTPITLSADQTLCVGSSATLSVTSDTTDYHTYTWSPDTLLYLDSARTIPYTGQNAKTVYFYTPGLLDSLTYTVTGLDTLTLCADLASTEVKVKGVEISVTADDSLICLGQSNRLIAAEVTQFGIAENIAPQAVAAASTCNTAPNGCAAFNDLSYGTCGTQQIWITTSTPPSTVPGTEWFSFTWSSARRIDRMVIEHAETTSRFLCGGLIQVWNGSTWIDHLSFTGLPLQCSNSISFPAVVTTAIRVTSFQACGSQLSNMNFREVEVWSSASVPTDVSYLWSPGGSTNDTVIATPATLGYHTYIVNAYDSVTQCAFVDSVTFEVDTLPTSLTASTPSTQCGFGVPTCSVTGLGSAFIWYTDSVGGTPIPNESDSMLNNYGISATTTFYVAQLSGICESARIPVIATVTAADSISLVASTMNACQNTAFTLTASNTGFTNNYKYTWTATPLVGSGLTGSDTGAVLSVTPTAIGTYTYSVIGTDTSATPDCGYSNSITVTVNQTPTITISADTVICPNEPFQLNVTQVGGGGNRVYTFNGTSQYIAVPNSASINLSSTAGNSFTLEAWVNEAAYPTVAPGDAGIISKYQVSGFPGYFLRTNEATPYSGFAAGGSAIARSTGNGVLLLNTWHHVAAVFTNVSATVDSVKIYKDGVLLTTGLTGTGVSNIPANTDSLRIGSDFGGRFFNGKIDEVRIWGAALSGTTLNAWKGRIVGPTHPNYAQLRLYYNFDQASSTTVTDLSPNGNTGYLRNNPAQSFSTSPVSNIVSYTWSPTTGLSDSTIANPTATITDTTTYTVVATAGNGCTSSASVTLNALPTAPAPVAINSVQCGTGVPTCKVVGSGGSFLWYTTPTGGTPILGEIYDSLTSYSIFTTTVFYVAEFDGTCIGPRVADTAYVFHPDSVFVTASADTICVNTPITLTGYKAGSTHTYNYSWASSPVGGSGLTGFETNDTLVISPSVAGLYTYTLTGSDTTLSCVTQNSVTVFVRPGPTAPLPTANPTAVCPGSSSQLRSNAFTSGAGVHGTFNATTNNSSSVVAFDLKNKSTVPITVHFFSVGLTAAAGNTVSNSLWYLPSSMNCLFPTTTPGPGWILVGTANMTSAGLGSAGVRTVLPVDANITIPPGATYAFAIGGSSIAYVTGTSGCPIIGSDAFLESYEGYGGSTTSTIANRQWTGDVTYDFLVGDAGLQYVWSPGATLSSDTATNPIATPISTTTYTVTAFSPVTGCFSSGTVTLNVNGTSGNLAFTANPDTVCNKGPVAFSVDTPVAGVTYIWQRSTTGLPGSWVTIDTGLTANSDSISANTYFRVYTSCGTFGDTSVASIVPVLNPFVTSVATTTRCGPGPITFTATGNGTFDWFSTLTGGTALETDTNVFTAFAAATTGFYVEAHIGTCKDPRFAVTAPLFVSPIATVNVSPNDTVCAGTSITLTAASTADTNYTFIWTLDLVNPLDSGSVYTFTADSTRTYYMYAVDSVPASPNYGCSYLVTNRIVVNQLPATPIIGQSDSVICSVGGLDTLTILNPPPPPSTGWNYNVNAISYAPVTPTGAPTVLCDAGLALTTLSFGSLDDGGWTGIPLPAGFNFSYWGTPVTNLSIGTNGFIELISPQSGASGCCSGQNLPNATTPNAVVALAWEDQTLTASGTIDFFVNGSAPNRQFVIRYTSVPRFSGLSGVTTGQIILNETSNFIDLQVTTITCDVGDLTTMGIENLTGTAAAVVPGRNQVGGWSSNNEGWRFSPIYPAPNILYSWSPALGLDTTAGQQVLALVSSTTTYTVTVSNPATGCTNSATATVTYDPITLPTITPAGPDTICQGQSDTLDAGSGYNSYLWISGVDTLGTTQSIIVTPTATTNYTVTVDNASGCIASVVYTKYMLPVTAPVISANGPLTFCDGDSVILDASGGYVSYSWSDGVNIVGSDSVYVAYDAAVYTVTVTSANGCTSTDSDTVIVNPNPPVPTITPAGSVDVCDAGTGVTLVADTTGAGPGAIVFWNDANGGNTQSNSLYVDNTSIDFIITPGPYYLANVTVQNQFGCSSVSLDDTLNLVTCVNNVTLDVKMFIEGYYTGSYSMDNFGSGGCMFMSGVSADPLHSDVVTIHAVDPSTLTVVESVTDTLKTDGTVSVTFSPSVVPGNSYYIKVTHRSAIETWSADSVLFSASTSYDFSSAQSQAYGLNMIQIGTTWGDTATWAFFSGDISDPGFGVGFQDGIVESQDYADMENAVYNIASGYVVEDITGDAIVESADYAMMENAVYSIISRITP